MIQYQTASSPAARPRASKNGQPGVIGGRWSLKICAYDMVMHVERQPRSQVPSGDGWGRMHREMRKREEKETREEERKFGRDLEIWRR
jgi:hypothetical protein